MNEDYRKVQDEARRLGFRVVPMLRGEDDLPVVEERGKPHEANRGGNLESQRGFKLMPISKDDMVVAALKQIARMLWLIAISILSGAFLIVVL